MERHDSSPSDAKLKAPSCLSCNQKPGVELHATPHHSASQRSLGRSIAIVATCTGAMLVHTLNSVSVSISLPVIGETIGVQEGQLQWLLSAYSLSSGCLLLFFGRLVDLYGRKKGFLIGVSWQMIFALGLGFSSNGLTLDVLRGLQGMGPAAAIPASLGVLAQSFPPSRARSIAFATFAAGSPIGGAFGTIIGGVLTQLSSVHWRAPFFLSAALSALCALGAVLSFDADAVSSEADARVDWIGAFLVTAGLVLIVFVLSQGSIAGWNTSCTSRLPSVPSKVYTLTCINVIACLVIGVILLAIFIAWEYHLERSAADTNRQLSFWKPPPLMKLSIWTRAKGRMAVVLVIAFLNWSGFISWIFWAQLYYQNYLGLTPIHTMLRFVPMFITGFLCTIFVGLIVSKLPLVVFFVSGTLVTGIACVLFAVINPSVTYWAFAFPSTAMIVVGADFVYSAGTIFVAKLVFSHEQCLAGGLFQMMTQIGTVFGLAVSTIVFDTVVSTTQSTTSSVATNSAGTNIPTTADLRGYKFAQWTNATFPFFASFLAAIFLRQIGIIGTHEDAPEENLTASALEKEMTSNHKI